MVNNLLRDDVDLSNFIGKEVFNLKIERELENEDGAHYHKLTIFFKDNLVLEIISWDSESYSSGLTINEKSLSMKEELK